MSDSPNATGYRFAEIEARWQEYWQKNQSFKAKDFASKPKYYILDMFPYPSGSGLHVGHVEGYTASDIMSRFKRMQGFNVLHPMGWDAFGLPAEQYAIKTNTHPRVSTAKNIATYTDQLRRLGLSYDWQREINTTDPQYYRWTQWIFSKLYAKGLAYQAEMAVNWCPELGTVLADEEVVDGKSEVGSFPVERRKIKQWVLRITEYAERLLKDLEGLDWPESTKEMQRNWIGRSEGCYLDFAVDGSDSSFRVFTTRQDTLWGVSFCVLAPEHPLVAAIVSDSQRDAVSSYATASARKSNLERLTQSKVKSGVATGAFALHPATKRRLPIFVADYVLADYGTGAVMGVPAHDARDHEFALNHGLPIVDVIEDGRTVDTSKEVHLVAIGKGRMKNSGFINGLSTSEALLEVAAWAEREGCGQGAVTYRLRDWIFSRQRYWGEPFPIVHDESGNTVCIKDEDLPVLLPEIDDFRPTGTFAPPLATRTEWVNTVVDGKSVRREANIMPQWAGSCWYYLRFLDPSNDDAAWDKDKESYWMPVDLYVGGVEHANLHLLYARFWHKVLFDAGLVSHPEPFKRLVHPGIILGENNEKMSKSKGNVVNPNAVVAQWGADSLRLFEMFLGPIEQTKPWQTRGIVGIHRFLNRLWRLIIKDDKALACIVKGNHQLEQHLARMLKKVVEDTEAMQFNTAIAAMMEFVNAAYKLGGLTVEQAERLVLVLSPYAPHIAEELWLRLGHSTSLVDHPLPAYDPKLIVADTISLAVMIDGRLRGKISVPADASRAEVLALARDQEFTKRYLAGHKVQKEIFVPGKIVNFVLGA